MIDMHTHLDLYPNALNILKKVDTHNHFTLAVTTSPRAWIATSKVLKGYRNIKVALGLHPEIVEQKANELDLLLKLIPKSRFIGEIGIDSSKRYLSTLAMQEYIFESAINGCQKCGGRVISIHSRGAARKVLDVLQRYPGCGTPILHWFSGSISELKQAVEIGCFFSVNPLMINTKKGQDLVSRMPVETVLPESDGPFAKLGSKPIMPWEAIKISSSLSEIWKLSAREVENILLRNTLLIRKR